MAAAYPASIPTLQTAGTYLDSNPHDVLHDSMYDEIVAIATELGTNPKGSSTAVTNRVYSAFYATGTTWADGSHQILQSVTVTLNTAATLTRYQQIGKLVRVDTEYYATTGTAGTAGNAIILKMPHTFITGSVHGFGRWNDNGTTTDANCYFVEYSTNQVQMVANTSGGSYIGAAPSTSMANGDGFVATIWYEVA